MISESYLHLAEDAQRQNRAGVLKSPKQADVAVGEIIRRARFSGERDKNIFLDPP